MRVRSNEEWVRALRADGPEQEQALKELRERTLRGIHAFLIGDHAGRGSLSREEAGQLAQDCAQEALLTILSKLETFRGDSRFTTWAYQVAIRILLGELRRRRWKRISLDQLPIGEECPAWPFEDGKSPDPERALHQEQVWRILTEIIENDLTARQRSALVAHAFQGMPLDQVAEWLGTNRDNVYKLIHDARRKLKQSLIARGLSQQEILAAFKRPE